MKELFIVLAAIAACALAYTYEDLRTICSVSATGTATVSGIPSLSSVSGRMIRVRNTARYDVIVGPSAVASIIVRPDVDATYFYMIQGGCFASFALNMDHYGYLGALEPGFEVYGMFSLDQQGNEILLAGMFFENGELRKEFFYINETINVTIKYTEVNLDYEHEAIDDAFSLTEQQCVLPDSWTKATQAKTSDKCSFDKEMPNLCSLSANGTVDMFDWSSFSELTKYVQMIRVKDFARYDFYHDEDHENLMVSYVVRSDLETCYYNQPGSLSCGEEDYFYPMRYCEWVDNENGVDKYDCGHLMWLDKDGKLLQESFNIYQLDYDLRINYTSWDYEYVHDTVDKAFSFDGDSCPPEVKTEAEYANSSLLCNPKFVQPQFPGCAFELDALVVVYENLVYNMKFMIKNKDLYYSSLSVTSEYMNTSMLTRCDIKDKRGYCYVVDRVVYADEGSESKRRRDDSSGSAGEEEFCYEGFSSEEFYNSIVFGFVYYGEPEPVKCPPDNSTGCLLYSNYETEEEAIMKGDKLVWYSGALITYKTSVPTPADFDSVDCDGNAIQSAVDLCSNPGPSSAAPGSGSSTAPASASSAGGSTTSAASFSLPSLLVAAVAVLFALF